MLGKSSSIPSGSTARDYSPATTTAPSHGHLHENGRSLRSTEEEEEEDGGGPGHEASPLLGSVPDYGGVGAVDVREAVWAETRSPYDGSPKGREAGTFKALGPPTLLQQLGGALEVRKKDADRWFVRLFPALAVLQWWFFNVLLVLLNKWIFEVYRFDFPLTLTTAHFALSFVGAYVCIRIFKLRPLAKVTGEALLRRVLPMAIVTNLNVCLGNVSLSYIPVTFMQTVKAFTPATTVLLQMLCQGKTFDPRVFLSLVPVVGGVTLASATELSFHLLGFLAALTSTIFTSANSILAEILLKGHLDMDSINTVYFMAPQIFAVLAPLALSLEAQDVIRWYYDDPDRTIPLLAVLISGFLAFGLNFSLFFAIQATSAMTFNVAGNMKVAVAMLLGWLIYRNPMSLYSCLGCAVTVVGCTFYGYIQHRVRLEQQVQLETQQALHLSPPPTKPANPLSPTRHKIVDGRVELDFSHTMGGLLSSNPPPPRSSRSSKTSIHQD